MCKLLSRLLILFVMYLAIPINLSGQNDSIAVEPSTVRTDKISSLINQPLTEPNSSTVTRTPLTMLEFFLSILVLVFGLGVILFETILIRTHKVSIEVSFKFLTITLIITSTLFLITAGYSNNQIAPAVGLLGTIAGYLLGKGTSQLKPDSPE